MKKLLLVFCLSLLFSSVAHAEIYQNEQFNFQVKFPPGWSNSVEHMLSNSLIEKYQLIKFDEEFLGLIALNAVPNTNPSDGQPIIDFTDETKQQEFLPIVREKVQQEFPNATINTAEFSTINNNPVLIINYDIIFSNLTLRRADAYILLEENCIIITLMTDDLNGDIYFSQFFQVLESCQTIPADFNEN